MPDKKNAAKEQGSWSKLKKIIKKKPFIIGLIILITGILFFSLLSHKNVKNLRTYNEVEPVDFNVSELSPASVYTDDSGKSVLGRPNSLYINFYSDVSFNTEEEKAALKEIKITPPVKGEWRWDYPSRLSFTPAEEWPESREFTVKFPRNIVGSNTEGQTVKLARYDFKFKSPVFTLKEKSFNLRQDAENPKIYNLIAEFAFSHSVNPEEFEKHISLKLEKRPLAYSVIYDGLKRRATIKSVPVQIKERPQLANLIIGKFRGAAEINKTLDIQGTSKFFNIGTVNSQIVRNAKDEPEQILFVNFTDSLTAAELEGKVSAYILPKTNPNKDKRPAAGSKTNCRDIEETQCDCPSCYDGDCYDEDCKCETVLVNVCDNVGSYNKNDMWVTADITPEVLKTLKKVDLTPIALAEDHAKTFSFRYSLDPEAVNKIFVLVSAPLESRSGFKISIDKGFIATVPSFPRELKIVGGGSLISLGGSKSITFVSRGIDGIKVEASRILPGSINHLVSQTYGEFQRPYFENSYNFNESNISEKFTDTISLVKTTQKSGYSSFNLGKYLTPGKTGLFLLDTYGYDPKTKSSQTSKERRLVLVTDLGILVKRDIDDGRRVFIMSTSKGSPVSGAKVELLGRNGLPVFTKYTGEEGFADFPSLKNLNNEKEPVVFVATLGDDVSFIPLQRYDRKVDYSRFETEGVYFSSFKDKGLSAFLFSDRGIYRPGEDINIGAIVKTPDWGYVGGIPVKLLAKDPQGKNIYEKTVSLPADGFTDFNIETQPTAVTGSYQIYLYDVTDIKRQKQLGSTSIKLEEFQEDKLRVKAVILGGGKKGWQPMEGLSAKVSVENLYGTPAQGNSVKGRLELKPITFRFSKYKDFSFVDPYSRKNASQIHSAGFDIMSGAATNEAGLVTEDINLSSYSGGSYNLTFSAEAFEVESGASVLGADSAWVSPSKYLVGYKSANNLNYLKRNSSASVDFVAIDPDLEQIPQEKLTAKIIMRQYVSTLVKQYNGTYKYQSVLKEEEKSSKPFAIKKGGSSIVLDTSSPGQYALELTDEFNEKVARVEYFITGSANLTYSLEKDAELKLTLEKTEVGPGEDLTVNIISPYTGAGLITIEREKVFAQKWFKSATTSTQQTIKVPEDFEGNGYINVSFVRGLNSDDIFSSPHSYAVIPFFVKRDKRTVKITLDTPEIVKPGEKLEIGYKTSQDSKIIIYGVSEGILQVAKYKLPKPLDHFLKKMALEVSTWQIMDLLLPDYKMVAQMAATGGDIDEEAAMKLLAANLNPFARKRDKPVVFWSGVMQSTTEAKTFTYEVPSYFNGEIRVMAVAANAGAAGSASTAVKAQAPIILMSGAPFMAVPGDKFDITLRAANNISSAKDGRINIDITTSPNIEIIGDAKASINVPYGSDATVKFKARALDNLGAAEIKFYAEHPSSKEFVTARHTLSVRPETSYTTEFTAGVISKKSGVIKGFDRDMFDFAARRDIFLSNSPLIVAKGLAKFFEKFPHGCSEQITSQVYPFLALAPEKGAGIMDRREVEDSFAKAFAKLRVRQLNNGSFSMWDGGSEDRDITLYLMNFFTDAKDYGYNVQESTFAKGIERLDDYAAKYPANSREAAQAAYSAYLLARNGKVITNYLLRTQEFLDKNQKDWQTTITGAYIASAYKLLKDDKKAEEIISKYKYEDAALRYYSDFDSTAIRNATFIYLLGKHFPERIGKVSDILMPLVENIVNNKYNTISAAVTIKAVAAYSEAMTGLDEKIKLYEKLAGAKDFKAVELDKTNSVPAHSFGEDVKEFKAEGKGGPLGLFFMVSTQGFDRKAPAASKAKGLEITREYLTSAPDKPSKAVTSADIGDELIVKIKIRSTAKDEVTNVAVTDLLPGAFEIISGSVNGRLDFYDMREDRALLYLTASKNIKEITYKVKVIASGEFTAPPVYAASLYDTDTSGMTKAVKFTVKPRS